MMKTAKTSLSYYTPYARIFSRCKIPNVPRVYDAIVSLHPGFPRIAGRDVINAPTLTSEKYTLVSSTLGASAAPYLTESDSLKNGLFKKKAAAVGFLHRLCLRPFRLNINRMAPLNAMCHRKQD